MRTTLIAGFFILFVTGICAFFVWNSSEGISKNEPPIIADADHDAVVGSQLRVSKALNLKTRVPRSSQNVTISIPVENISDRPVSLNRVIGSCSCFRGASHPRSIQPNEKANIMARFDTRDMQGDRFLANLVLISSDATAPEIPVIISAEFSFDDLVFCDPPTYVLGRISPVEIENISINVNVYCHKSRSKEIESNIAVAGSQALNISRVSLDEDEPKSMGRFIKIAEYSVQIDKSRIRAGPNREPVVISFPNSSVPSLTCVVEFDVISGVSSNQL